MRAGDTQFDWEQAIGRSCYVEVEEKANGWSNIKGLIPIVGAAPAVSSNKAAAPAPAPTAPAAAPAVPSSPGEAKPSAQDFILLKKGVDLNTVRFVNVGSSADVFRAIVAKTVDAGPAQADIFDQLEKYIFFEPVQFAETVARLALKLLSGMLAFLTIVAGLDFLYQKFSLLRKLRMSREEIREHMSGNICRCGAYSNIVEAISEVAARRKA